MLIRVSVPKGLYVGTDTTKIWCANRKEANEQLKAFKKLGFYDATIIKAP